MKEIMDIISAFDEANSAGKQTALATVVHVEGSSYRREGARMLIAEDGQITGAISGGCLEGDALRKALFVMQEKKAKLVVYDTSNEDDVEVGFQLGCNGIIQVLIEPISNDKSNNPISILKEALSTRHYAIVATVFSLNRNSPQVGTCLLLKENGTIVKTIRDDRLVDIVAGDAKTGLMQRESSIKNYVYEESELTAFINLIKPQITLVVVGAGNDAMPVVKIAELLGWKAMVVDGRSNYANTKRFSSGCQVIVSKPEKIFSQINIDDQTVFVLMTHNYNYDLAMLRELIIRNVRYIGVLGSGAKMKRMIEELKDQKLDMDKELPKIFGPVGLDVGAETPEEIALSILVEIQTVLKGGTGKHLRHHDLPVNTHSKEELKEIIRK